MFRSLADRTFQLRHLVVHLGRRGCAAGRAIATPHRRVRRTPFSEGSLRSGVRIPAVVSYFWSSRPGTSANFLQRSLFSHFSYVGPLEFLVGGRGDLVVLDENPQDLLSSACAVPPKCSLTEAMFSITSLLYSSYISV